MGLCGGLLCLASGKGEVPTKRCTRGLRNGDRLVPGAPLPCFWRLHPAPGPHLPPEGAALPRAVASFALLPPSPMGIPIPQNHLAPARGPVQRFLRCLNQIVALLSSTRRPGYQYQSAQNQRIGCGLRNGICRTDSGAVIVFIIRRCKGNIGVGSMKLE